MDVLVFLKGTSDKLCLSVLELLFCEIGGWWWKWKMSMFWMRHLCSA